MPDSRVWLSRLPHECSYAQRGTIFFSNKINNAARDFNGMAGGVRAQQILTVIAGEGDGLDYIDMVDE